MDFFEKRKKELGLGGGGDASSDFFEQRKIKLGLAPDPVAEQMRKDYSDVFNPMKQLENIKATIAPPTEPQQSSEQWVNERLAREREAASKHPITKAINSALEPISKLVYTANAKIPGVAAFQEGTGQALGIQTFAPPNQNTFVDKSARIVGNIAGAVTNPSNIGQGLVTAPLQAGRGVAQAAANKAPVLGNKFAQRGIEGAVAGGIQGGVISGVRGETDANELATNIGLGIGLGAAGDLALTGVGSLVRAAGNKATDAAQGILGQQIKTANAIESASRGVPTNRLKVQNNTNKLDKVMTEIEPIVNERMTPPLENPKELVKWLQPHLGDVSLNEIRKLPYEDMHQLATEVQRNMNVFDTAKQVAKEKGYDLEPLLDGTVPTFKEAAERLRLGGVAGAIEPPKNVKIALRNDLSPSATGKQGQINTLSDPLENINSRKVDDVEAFNNSGLGDADSFDAKISRQKGKEKVSFSQRWEELRTQFIDDVAPLEGLEKRVTGHVASAEDSLYKSARLFKGTPERAAQTVTDRLAPIVKSVEDAGYTSDDLGRYALAKHAQDVNNAGYKSGYTNAEIKDVLSKLSSAEMEAAQQALVKVNRDMLSELVDSGVVSKHLADILDDRWKNYIPLFREFNDDMVEFGGGLSKALANVSDPIKALKGSERAVIDPLENMVKNIFQSINSSERNKVATQLARLATKDMDGQFIRKLDPDEKIGRKNVVSVREGGESVKYEVEPEVYKAMLNLDQESSNMLISILSKPASLLRAGATLTPEFSLRNPIRDIVQAYVTSNSGFNPITDFGAGLIQSITKGNLYKQWIENLGGYGNVISQDRDVHRKALEKVLKQPASKKFVNIINGKGLISLLRAISDTTESATKVGEFRAALRQGQTLQEAAYRSRDIMDFGRAGTSIRQANKVIAFLNANLQGKSKIIRSIKENPVGTTARAFASVTVPTIAIYALNHSLANEIQKETIAEAPDWQKDAFWLVAIPGTDLVARIPKPFDIAPIFANLPEKALDFVRDNDKDAFDGFIKRTGKDMALPSQLSGLLPFIEGMADYSFFREGNIIPQREKGLDFKDQYDPVRTTETAKFLAARAHKLTGGKGAFKNFSSPRVMDNTIKGLTAGLGTYATSAIDIILEGVGAVKRPEAPEKRIEQRPLAKAFLVDPLQGGKSMDKFYDEREKLQNQKNSSKLNNNPFEMEGRLKQLNSVADVMSKINSRIRDIERSNLSAKEKRDEIESLIKQRNSLSKEAVKDGGLK